jgi:hypothetical protein
MKKTISTLLVFALMLLVAATAVAADSELVIDKIEITSDDKTLLRTSSDSGDIDVYPGQELEIKVILENTFDDETDNDIEDARVSAVIEDIDDGDDESDSSEDVKVRADGTKTVKLKLKIPKDASSYESYDLEITATGYDQDGVKHTDDAVIDVDVDREDHEIVFEMLQISDVYCGDTDAMIKVEIQNTGEEDEYDVILRIRQYELGTLFSDTFDLPSLDSEEDSTYRKTKLIDLYGLPSGRHDLTVEVEYDDGDEKLSKTLEFEIEDCGRATEPAKQPEETKTKPTEQYSNPDRDLTFLFGEEEQEIVVQMPPAGAPTPATIPPAKETSTLTIVALAMANIAIIIFIVLLAITLYDKKSDMEKLEENLDLDKFK